jgi:putative endonuclease
MNPSRDIFPADLISGDTPVTVSPHLELGRHGEELAAAYLLQQGFRIVAANFVIPVGRNRIGVTISVEIDLVAYDGDTLCFVEVKSRESGWFAGPQANVDRRKQRQIARAARAYLRMFDLSGEPYRFDVVTVVMSASGTAGVPPASDAKNKPELENKMANDAGETPAVPVRSNTEAAAGPEIQLLRNYWSADSLRKRSWSDRYYD